jgi:V4R domain
MQDDLASRFRLTYDREGYRRVIAGHEVIVHCHHYNARIQSTIEGATQIDGRAILSSSAEAVFGEQVRAAFLPSDGEAERWRVAAALYAHLGYGSLDLARLRDGFVVQTSSHFVEGWHAGFRGRNAPVCTFTEGFLQGAAHAVTGQAVYVRERACMAAGASACEFEIERGRQEPVASFAKRPLTFAPKKGGTYVRSPNVDQEAIVSALVEMPIHGDDEGLIPAFGVYLANTPADFYNLVCIRFVEEMAKQGLFRSACRLLTYDAETCGMNTFRGIMSSAEWDGLVAPMIREQADNFFAILAVSNALGWGNWHPVTHVPGERATLESLNGYEALGYLGYRGMSRLPQCFMLTGVAAGIMELLYATGPIESRFGRFAPSEEVCICTGRPNCTFDVTKV